MEHKKGFIKGALAGALLTLLVMSLAACGLQHIDEGIISSDTETKLSYLKKLIDETYLLLRLLPLRLLLSYILF